MWGLFQVHLQWLTVSLRTAAKASSHGPPQEQVHHMATIEGSHRVSEPQRRIHNRSQSFYNLLWEGYNTSAII